MCGPKDLEDFRSSRNKVCRVACKHRLAEHEIHKLSLAKVETLQAVRRCTFPEVLDLKIHTLRLGNYIQAMVVHYWDALSEWLGWLLADVSEQQDLCRGHRMQAIEKAVRDTDSIT